MACRTGVQRIGSWFFSRRLRFAGVTLVAAAALGGCVSEQAYDDVVSENRTLTSRNADLAGEVEELEATIDSLQGTRTAAASTLDELEEENALLRQQLAQTESTISNLEDRMGELRFDRLDPATDAALEELQRRFPDLITYDASRGVLRFASDLTFDSGSAVVKDAARQSLRALSTALQAPEAGQYDLRVVGHTDSQPLSPSTKQRFPTNMHLSVARAIAVRDALISMGVDADRMQAAGWGPHRPLVPNTPSGNTPANRRVELFLVPGGIGTSGAPGGGGGGSAGQIDRERLDAERFDPTK